MRNPRLGAEVSRDWLVHMLTCYERRRDPGVHVEVIDYEVKAGRSGQVRSGQAKLSQVMWFVFFFDVKICFIFIRFFFFLFLLPTWLRK